MSSKNSRFFDTKNNANFTTFANCSYIYVLFAPYSAISSPHLPITPIWLKTASNKLLRLQTKAGLLKVLDHRMPDQRLFTVITEFNFFRRSKQTVKIFTAFLIDLLWTFPDLPWFQASQIIYLVQQHINYCWYFIKQWSLMYLNI